jgi:hypothetical protein
MSFAQMSFSRMSLYANVTLCKCHSTFLKWSSRFEVAVCRNRQAPMIGGCFKIFSFYRAKVHLAKYMSLWLIAEGIVILSGLGYNGRDSAGNILWNGGANVKLGVYENSTRFQHVRQQLRRAARKPIEDNLKGVLGLSFRLKVRLSSLLCSQCTACTSTPSPRAENSAQVSPLLSVADFL